MPKKLAIESNITLDFNILGISTTLQDYRLAWYLNKQANFQLKKQLDYIVLNPKEQIENSFSFFIDETNVSIHLYLIQNKNENDYLFPKWKKFDFLLVLKDLEGDFDSDNLMNQFKYIPFVSYTYLIDNTTIKLMEKGLIKKLNNFFTDIELHVLQINNTKTYEYKKKHYLGKN